MRSAKQLSNDPNMSCRVFCNICDRLYFLSGLRKHVAHKHSLTYTEYKRRFGGDPRRQIINSVYHCCVLCKKVVLLDTDELGKHLKDHRLGYTQYMKQNMKKGSGLLTDKKFSQHKPTPPSKPKAKPVPETKIKTVPTEFKVKTTPTEMRAKLALSESRSKAGVEASPPGPRTRSQARSLPLSPGLGAMTSSVRLPPSPPLTPPPDQPLTPLPVKKEPVEENSYFPVKQEPMEPMEQAEPLAPVEPKLILIQCEICSRTFKQNIQLKVHMRKTHS